jgi:biopolymer transport protein ExbB
MNHVGAMGVFGFWVQADAVGRGTAVVLLLMSVATWYLIATKTLQVWRVRRHAGAVLAAFWSAPTLEQAAADSRAVAADSPFGAVAAAGAAVQARRPRGDSLADALDAGEYATRMLRQAVQRGSRELDAGLSTLASVGATAPFVGLFGTVWGIYHALLGIGFTGQASIDKVAGPVGEALIMTALGIAVAVPAVLAYNFLLRVNRAIAQELDGFAHDLHAYLTRDVRTPAEGSAASTATRGA